MTTRNSAKFRVLLYNSLQVLNNDPLVGHKTIPIRNMYQEPPQDVADNIPDRERAPPTNTRLSGDGRHRLESIMSRVCPVCEEDFG